MSGNTESVRVSVFGSDFYLRASDVEDKEYIVNIASHVDKTMQSIAGQTGLNNTTKIAILAAINIADELYQKKSGISNVENLRERTIRLCKMLDESL